LINIIIFFFLLQRINKELKKVVDHTCEFHHLFLTLISFTHPTSWLNNKYQYLSSRTNHPIRFIL
jgi:hypothetical protein